MTFADSQVVYRDLDGVWGSFRLFVGGKDVTYFRGVPSQIGGYQLTEPYSFGPADFLLPQVTMFEVDNWGTGSLKWLYNGATVVLKQVDDAGAVVRTVWRGLITQPSVSSAGTALHCDGEASGRLAMLVRNPALFSIKEHVGRRIYDTFTSTRLTMTPRLGGDIGVLMDGRGMAGSKLDYLDSLLAYTIDTDGSQYTIAYRDAHSDYHLSLKDTSTVAFTAFNGAHGVDVDLSSDLSEQPTTVYGSGASPNGLVWSNAKFPGLVQGEAPDYPMDDNSSFGSGTTDADTDTGDGVTVMIAKLVGAGYLERVDKPGGYDSDVVDAIKDLQDDAGLTQSGTMTAATWRHLFDLDTTGFSLTHAYQAPLAQRPAVRRWNLTANGSKSGRNPNYDPKVVPVEIDVDYGPSCEKSRARRNAKGMLARRGDKDWAGTLTLTADVHTGDVNFAGTGSAVMSRLDIKPGTNFRLRNFDASTVFHVSIVNVSSDLSVTLGIDTQGRDAVSLAAVIARNIESRAHPARQWLRQRRTDVNSRRAEFSEAGGRLFNRVQCPGGQWTVFPVLAGQAGSVSRIRLQTSNAQAEFVLAAFGKEVSSPWMASHVGNPFETNKQGESKWTDTGVQNYLDGQRVLLGAWGDDTQPCGYFPRSHTKADGTVSDAPVTGLLLDDGGFDYHTFGQPVVWLAIYPRVDTVLKPQRVLWDVLESL